MSKVKLYDYRDDENLCKLTKKIEKVIRPLQKTAIIDACSNSDEIFRTRVQCAPLNGSSHTFMTMQELSEIKINDPGNQQIDYKAIEKLFFGHYGLLKHTKIPDLDIINKLVIPPRIILFRNNQGQSESPANGSGRHRNFALQMLCAAAGVTWENTMRQKIWVDKTVVSTNSEFEMAMILSNGAGRKQSQMELTAFNLNTSGVSSDDAEQIIDNRFNVKKEKWSHLFANLVMQYVPLHSHNSKKEYFSRAKTGWYKTYRLNDISKNKLNDIYENQPKTFQEIAKNLGENMHIIVAREFKNTTAIKKLTFRINEAVVDQICIAANLDKPIWETQQELFKKKFEENLRENAKLKELEQTF